MCIHALLIPTTGITFFLVGPGVHWAVQTRSHSNIFLQPPVHLLSASPLLPYSRVFLSTCLSLSSTSYSPSLLLSCYHQTSVQTVRTPCWFPPKSFHIFSSSLSHLIPARLFVIFSHTASSTMARINLFSGTFFTLHCHFNFLAFPFGLIGYIPSSAPSAPVLHIVLEHTNNSIFLAAVICTAAVSGCFTNFAFPSHTSPAYSSFGAIPFTKRKSSNTTIKIKVRSVRTASVLPGGRGACRNYLESAWDRFCTKSTP